MEPILSALAPLVVFAISFALDPRKFRTGLYLFAGLLWLGLSLFSHGFTAVERVWNTEIAAWYVLAVALIFAVTIVGLAIFLVLAGITLVRREGFRVSRLLSIGLGTALLAYIGVGVYAVVANAIEPFSWLLLLGLPAGYLGFAFASFLSYGALYPALMGRFGRPVVAVIVLGAGLIRGRVPALLASRLRRGRKVFDRSVRAGLTPRILTSGGKGDDEPLAEATAMARFLVEEGVAPEAVLVEDRSRDTRQNLRYSAEVLGQEQIEGLVAVVTSDFHAFRAAMLMRATGVPGYAVGAPTAAYYWPTAVIREFVAVLRDHVWLNAILLGLALLPLLVRLLST